MATSPLFLAKDIREPSLKGVQHDSRRDLWRTTFDFGSFTGNTVDFMFPTEGQASQFSPGQTYRPSDMLAILKTTEPFVVREVKQRINAGAVNRYTGRPERGESWTVFMSDDLNGTAVEWSFQSELSARRYTEGKPYYMQDMLGTMPSDPVATNTDRISYELKSAYAAKMEAKRAAEELQAAKDLAERLAEDLAAEAAKEALKEAKAKAADAAKKKAAADAAAKAANEKVAAEKKAAQERAAAAEALLPKTKSVFSDRGIPKWSLDTIQTYWTITNGGASGKYDGKYYKAGAFVPANGQWYGTFAGD